MFWTQFINNTNKQNTSQQNNNNITDEEPWPMISD